MAAHVEDVDGVLGAWLQSSPGPDIVGMQSKQKDGRSVSQSFCLWPSASKVDENEQLKEN